MRGLAAVDSVRETQAGSAPVPTPAQSHGVGAVLHLFRSQQVTTKADVVRVTGLARSTVTARVDALLDAGLLRTTGALSSGGRPAATLEFNPKAGVVVGVDLGANHATVGVCDLSGRVLAHASDARALSGLPEEVMEGLLDTAAACLDRVGIAPSQVWGLGVGFPGVIEFSTGRPTKPFDLIAWDGFDIRGYASRRLDAPVYVDNDANLLALGERALRWPTCDDLLFVKVSTGIGASVIAGGRLQRGAVGAAGELGHVQVPRIPGWSRADDDDRDLDAIASGRALAAELSTAGHSMTPADAIEQLRAGNPEAVEFVRRGGQSVGEVLSVAVNLLNPALIVIGGSIAAEGEHLLAGVREVVYGRSMPLATRSLQVVPATAGNLGGVIGAAHLVFEHILSDAEIERRVGVGES